MPGPKPGRWNPEGIVRNNAEKMKYNKDYSGKTAKEWLAEGKWTAFLMQVPLGGAKPYMVGDANDLNCIRTTAAILNKNPECDRMFSLGVDFDTKVISVTATLKENGNL